MITLFPKIHIRNVEQKPEENAVTGQQKCAYNWKSPPDAVLDLTRHEFACQSLVLLKYNSTFVLKTCEMRTASTLTDLAV